MDDEFSERLLAQGSARTTRVHTTFREIVEIRDAVTAGMAAGGEKLHGTTDAATKNAIMLEVGVTIEANTSRLAKLVTWFEADVGALDATITMILDRAAPLVGDSAARTLVEAVSTLGPGAHEFELGIRGLVDTLDSLSDLHEAVRRPASRMAGSVERLLDASVTLAAVGQRAQAMLDDM